jgi:hypothetical protein
VDTNGVLVVQPINVNSGSQQDNIQ